MRQFIRHIVTQICNRIAWRLTIRDLMKRFLIVEVLSIVGVVIGVVVIISLMFDGLLGDVRAEVQATIEIEQNADIRISPRGGELALGKFQVVRSSSTLQSGQNKTTGRSGKGDSIRIVEIDARVVLNTFDKREIVRFHGTLKHHKYRLRQLFDETIRQATHENLIEPDLSTLRGMIRNGINTMIGTKLVEEILFTHFRSYRLPKSYYAFQNVPRNLGSPTVAAFSAHRRQSGMDTHSTETRTFRRKRKRAGVGNTGPQRDCLMRRELGYLEAFASRSASFLKYSSTA